MQASHMNRRWLVSLNEFTASSLGKQAAGREDVLHHPDTVQPFDKLLRVCRAAANEITAAITAA